MPHIIVQMYPGRSEEVKQQIAQFIQGSLSEQMNMEPGLFSVSIKEIPQSEWDKQVNEKLKDDKDVYIKPGMSYRVFTSEETEPGFKKETGKQP